LATADSLENVFDHARSLYSNSRMVRHGTLGPSSVLPGRGPTRDNYDISLKIC
jgi:hypothetical protein